MDCNLHHAQTLSTQQHSAPYYYYRWASPYFPHHITDKLLGRRYESIRALQAYFYILTISLNPTTCAFYVCISHPTGDDVEKSFYEMCKSRIVSLLNSINTLFPPCTTDIVLSSSLNTHLLFLKCPHSNLLPTHHKLSYMLARQSTKPIHCADLLQLMHLDDSPSPKSASSYAIYSNDYSLPDLASAMYKLIHAFDQVVRFYHSRRKAHPIPTFKLSVSFGFHVYSRSGISGDLASSLPTKPDNAFLLKSALNATRHKYLRSKFLNTFSPYCKQPIELAMPTVFGMAAIETSLEKIAIRFELKASHWYPGALRIGVTIPTAYVPFFEFKADLVYDPACHLFLQPAAKDLRLSAVPISTITLIKLASPHLSTSKIPISRKLTQSVVQPTDGPSTADWGLAKDVFNEIVAYVNSNADLFHDLGVVINTSGHPVPALPPSIIENVLTLSIHHELVTKARKPPIEMVVKNVTVLANIRKDFDRSNRIIDTDVPFPTFTTVSLKHAKFHSRIMNAKSASEREFWVRKEVAAMLPMVNRVTQFLEEEQS